MSIETYFKPRDGIPNPKGPLPLFVPLQVTALTSTEVVKATRDKSKKRGPYKKRVLNFKNSSMLHICWGWHLAYWQYSTVHTKYFVLEIFGQIDNVWKFLNMKF